MLSGLFFLQQLCRKPASSLLKNRGLRLLYPMVLWTYIFITFKLLAGGFTNQPIDPSDALIFPFPGKYHLWFLWALFLIQTFLLITKPLFHNFDNTIVLMVLFLGSFILIAMPLPDSAYPWVAAARFHLPTFIAGMGLGLFRKPLALIPPWLAAFAFLILLIVPPALYAHEFVWAPLFSIAVCLPLFTKIRWVSSFSFMRFFSRLGTASMAIYLCHTIFSAATREGLLLLGINNLTTHLLAGTATGIVLSHIIYLISWRLSMARILGF